METSTFFTRLELAFRKNLGRMVFGVLRFSCRCLSRWSVEKLIRLTRKSHSADGNLCILKSTMPSINLTAFGAYKTIQTFITSINMLAFLGEREGEKSLCHSTPQIPSH